MDSTTPLLSTDRDDRKTPTRRSVSAPPNDRYNDSEVEASRSMPKLQILLLCYARLMEPMAFFSIFPYIAQMTQHNGKMPESDIGFYSGLFESLFSAVQALVLIFWGSMADRFGGKTMLVYSLLGMIVGPTLFGFATSLWQMALFRCFTGLVSGGNIITRTMIGERCTRETQARAFGWYSFAGNIALFVGPLLGGALADPAAQYPTVFGGLAFFEQFPFALPGIAIGTMSAIGAVVVFLFVDDTVERKETSQPDNPQGLDWASISGLIRAPGVSPVLWAFVHVMLLAAASMAVGTLALYTAIEQGGLGLSARQIAWCMTAQGAAEAVWMLLVFPFLHRRSGTKGILYICAIMFPFVFADYIALNAFLRDGSTAGLAGFWVGLSGVMIFGPGMWMSITAVQLALQEVSPNPRATGTLNAIAETCSSLIKSVIPALSTVIFATGVRGNILGGYLAWSVLVVFGMAFSVTIIWFPRKTSL